MAGNKTIFDLPLRTGVTADDRLAIVDSGNTLTSSVKVSDLRDGTGVNSLESLTGDLILSGGTGITITDNTTDTITITASGGGGGAFTTASFGTANLLPSYMDGTEIAAGNYNIIVGGGDDSTSPGFDNDILNTSGWSSIVGGRNNSINQSNSSYSLHSIIGGENNNVTGFGNGHFVIGARASTASGSGANAKYNIILGGEGNFDDGWGGAIVGTNNGDNAGRNNCVILGGDTNTINNSANDSGIVGGGSNTNSHDNCVILGGLSQTTLQDNEVVLPNVRITNYASLNFLDDTAAAAGNVQLGQIYHNAGALRVRIT